MSADQTLSTTPLGSPPKFEVPSAIPPLENGDRLTRGEFERRWGAMPHVKFAELIEGAVHMPSPVRYRDHGAQHNDFAIWAGTYRVYTFGVGSADDSSIRLDLDNMPQPDVMLRIISECGGQSRIDDDGYVQGSPELVGEVAASSASYDLHDKLHVYRRNGVQEYVVWRVLDNAFDWFVLQGGKFERLALPDDGIYRSTVFPGLWLDIKAFLARNMNDVLQVLQQGLATQEHKNFVARLAEHRGG